MISRQYIIDIGNVVRNIGSPNVHMNRYGFINSVESLQIDSNKSQVDDA